MHRGFIHIEEVIPPTELRQRGEVHGLPDRFQEGRQGTRRRGGVRHQREVHPLARDRPGRLLLLHRDQRHAVVHGGEHLGLDRRHRRRLETDARHLRQSQPQAVPVRDRRPALQRRRPPLAAAPGSPDLQQLRAEGSTAPLFVYEVAQAAPGAALDYLAAVRESARPSCRSTGTPPSASTSHDRWTTRSSCCGPPTRTPHCGSLAPMMRPSAWTTRCRRTTAS